MGATTSKTMEPTPKRLKHDPKLQMLKEAFGILKSAAEKPKQTDNEKDENPEAKSFCNYIYQKMKNYNRQTLNLVQQEIMQVIFRTDQTNYSYGHRYGSLPATTYGNQHASTFTELSVVTETDVPVATPYLGRSYSQPANSTTTTPILTPSPPVSHSPVDLHSTSFAHPPHTLTSIIPSPNNNSPSPRSVYSDNMEDFV